MTRVFVGAAFRKVGIKSRRPWLKVSEVAATPRIPRVAAQALCVLGILQLLQLLMLTLCISATPLVLVL